MSSPVYLPLSFTFNPKLFTKSLILGSCLFLDYALASKSTAFPATPGVSVTGLVGDDATGYADALIPLHGQPTAFFYVNPQGMYHSSDDYSVSLGFGGRKLTEAAGILGAYVFADYNHAPDGHGFWFVSPGIERLGNRWDFSANVYLPVGSDQVNTGSAFGSQMGIYDGVSFSGHSQFDQLYTTYESVGVGADAEIGYRLPVKNNTKLYLGGYHFSPKNVDNITGGTVRLEVPINERLNLNVSNGYDNVAHNTFKVGLTYSFGGRSSSMNFKDDLTERMVDATHRNLIAVAGSANTTQPIFNGAAASGQNALVMDNISFFSPNPISSSSEPDGSYENPYIGLTQENIDSANSGGNINLFFNGGYTYTANTAINLTNNNVYGRQSYQDRWFVQPASGDNRPLLEFPNSTGLIWNVTSGDSNILVTSVRLASSDYNNDIEVNNAGSGKVSLNIDNVDSSDNLAFGVYAKNLDDGALNVVINNSTFNGNFDGISAENYGSGTLDVTTYNSTINNNGNYGFIAYNFGTGTLNITTNNSTFNNNGHDGFSLVNYTGTANIIANHSTFNANQVRGWEISNSSTATLNITTNNSTFSDNAREGLFAFNNTGTLTITANNTIFAGNGTESGGSGMYARNLAGALFVTANNSAFVNNGNYGIQTENATSVVNNGSTFSGNASGDIDPPV